MPSSRPPDSSGEPSSTAERRRAQRAPIELRVEYRRLNSFFADYTRNISKGGTFIATPTPLPIGTEFRFRLTVPRLPEPIELRGAVAWTVTPEQATEAQPAGMGIRFRYADDAERARIHGAVEQLMIDSLGPALYRRLLVEAAAPPTGDDDDGSPARRQKP